WPGPVTLPDGGPPLAPSPVRVEHARIFTKDGWLDHVTPRAMTTAHAEAAIAAFAAEARNAIRAGFDGVEVHGANGYLVQQFLAENTNRRTDRFGGSLTRRLRFAVEVVEAVAAEVGAERVGRRISPDNPENEIAEEDPQGTERKRGGKREKRGREYLNVIERSDSPPLPDLRRR
ncbi:alkene reductase, partial [Streptomyces lunaelactis]|nr:alkene reductase [Streptomyces lunaelactis]